MKVADIVRRHGVARWQIYDWRRQLTSGKLSRGCLMARVTQGWINGGRL
ncbi:hypothetical protein C9E82_23285 [Paracoccus siganidrum]|uniref:Transposase n=1 Tax=Paracoccus siganidrum TaxID=1276757 RepID=A0A418ZU14_9RHOB|nr:hypothetical protein D3P05_21875 [Paracoccus siganidrum]RMC24723.1 hypothetical protein C9E82_23285 [Paracoccus siganidrum]